MGAVWMGVGAKVQLGMASYRLAATVQVLWLFWCEADSAAVQKHGTVTAYTMQRCHVHAPVAITLTLLLRCVVLRCVVFVLAARCAVRFAMDRAGLVGADGATHCGAFDVTYMASLPNMVCMAPSNEAELIHMVATAVAIDDGPSCFRFPRGNGVGVDLAAEGIAKDLKGTPLEVRGGCRGCCLSGGG